MCQPILFMDKVSNTYKIYEIEGNKIFDDSRILKVYIIYIYIYIIELYKKSVQ